MTNIFQALAAQTDWAILVLRLAIGLIFIAHGWNKIRNFTNVVNWMHTEVVRPGWLWAPLVTALEFGGGILIAVGLFVQPIALLLTVNMMVAFWYNFKSKKTFFHHLEIDLILIASLLLLATLGAGMYSASYYL